MRAKTRQTSRLQKVAIGKITMQSKKQSFIESTKKNIFSTHVDLLILFPLFDFFLFLPVIEDTSNNKKKLLKLDTMSKNKNNLVA